MVAEKYTHFVFLADSWLSLVERDTETPQEVKKGKAVKILEYIEECMETAIPEDEEVSWMLNMTITYVGVRQMIELPAEGEKEAHIVRAGA